MSSKKLTSHNELTCKPLNSLSDVTSFLQNPPAWRTLCKELTPHSDFAVRNVEINKNVTEFTLEKPQVFCHYSPEKQDIERHHTKKLPKTLVCHDMANGYHDDSVINGTGQYDAYNFYNWAGIDIFCYFSHHLITIPPLGWINVGHAHGVKVIGTMISEWNEGAEFWDKILSAEQEWQNFANSLVTIAKTLKFDGWLLNVENKISKPHSLLAFVRYLHATLHQELNEPVLIWYDSVTIFGDLNWQNALTDKNKDFFDACDGIFTNYSWSEPDIASSAALAGDRLRDIYVGIDIWGRNLFGGGKFNSSEAISIAYNHGCSLAIFAPAWTYEEIDNGAENIIESSVKLTKLEKFHLRVRALWDSIWPFLNTKLPSQLPFQTSFCRGQGEKRCLYGEVICPVPWYNLRHMQYQPNSSHGPHSYILSTLDLINMATDRGHFKDKVKILILRESFIKRTALTTLPTQISVENTVSVKEEIKKDDRNKSNEESVIEGQEKSHLTVFIQDNSPEEVGEEKTGGYEQEQTESVQFHGRKPSGNSYTVKRKIRNAIKQVFRKCRKISDENITLHEVNEVENLRDTKNNVLVANTIDDKCGVTDIELVTKLPENVSETEHEQSSAKISEEDDGGEDLTKKASRVKRLGESTAQISVNTDVREIKYTDQFKLAYVPDELECLEPYYNDSYNGGLSLKINPNDELSPNDHRYIRILHCDFYCQNTLVVCVVTKTLREYEDQTLDIILHAKNKNGQFVKIVLGHNSDKAVNPDINICPLELDGAAFKELQKYLLLNEPGFYIPVENSFGWNVWYYIIKLPESRILSVNCHTGLKDGPILLGHFGICSKVV